MWPLSGRGGRSSGRIPTDRVISLSSQGVPELEIINILKNEGYTPSQVDQAMKSALRGVASGYSQPPPKPGPEPPPDQPSQPPPQEPPPGDEFPTPAEFPQEMPPPPTTEPWPPKPPLTPDELQTPGGALDMPKLPGEPHYRPIGSPPPAPPETEQEYQEPLPHLRERKSIFEARDERRRAMEELAESVVEVKILS